MATGWKSVFFFFRIHLPTELLADSNSYRLQSKFLPNIILNDSLKSRFSSGPQVHIQANKSCMLFEAMQIWHTDHNGQLPW